jgi:hypothetical protein
VELFVRWIEVVSAMTCGCKLIMSAAKKSQRSYGDAKLYLKTIAVPRVTRLGPKPNSWTIV